MKHAIFPQKKQPRKILASGAAVGVSLTMVLLSLSVVVFSLRNLRLTIELNPDNDCRDRTDQSASSDAAPLLGAGKSWRGRLFAAGRSMAR